MAQLFSLTDFDRQVGHTEAEATHMAFLASLQHSSGAKSELSSEVLAELGLSHNVRGRQAFLGKQLSLGVWSACSWCRHKKPAVSGASERGHSRPTRP